MKKIVYLLFIIAVMAGCKKKSTPAPQTNYPSYVASMLKIHSWAGAFTKIEYNDYTSGASYDYKVLTTDTALSLNYKSDSTLGMSVLPMRLKFVNIDSTRQTILYDSTSDNMTAYLTYYYAGDSVVLTTSATTVTGTYTFTSVNTYLSAHIN